MVRVHPRARRLSQTKTSIVLVVDDGFHADLRCNSFVECLLSIKIQALWSSGVRGLRIGDSQSSGEGSTPF